MKHFLTIVCFIFVNSCEEDASNVVRLAYLRKGDLNPNEYVRGKTFKNKILFIRFIKIRRSPGLEFRQCSVLVQYNYAFHYDIPC